MTVRQRIYVAGQWSDTVAHRLVDELRRCGHLVYASDDLDGSFQWLNSPESVDVVGPREFDHQLRDHAVIARAALELDALNEAEVFVLVVPAARAADTLLGYALARGLRCVVVQSRPTSPELMYGLAEVITDPRAVCAALAGSSVAGGQQVCARY